MAGIWIYSEDCAVALQLLTAGQNLAYKLNEKITAITTNQEGAADLIACGADKVMVLAGQTDWVENYAQPIAAVLRDENPKVVLLGGTLRGKAVAANLAAQLKSGLVNSAFSIDGQEGSIETKRMMYGGLAVCTEVLSDGCIVTIEPRTYEKANTDASNSGEVVTSDVSLASEVHVDRIEPIVRQGADITAAKTVICVGRGLSAQEDMKLAEMLVQKTGGVIGCTRSIAEDYHWLPAEAYIGLSGQKVKPDLYLAFGVSGQIQHVAGIRDAKIIAAIDKNENAPIFAAADYGIVGDLHEIVPALIEKLG
ncbi:electron transfer flavoprotein subunit alpha/FixB family protein [Sporomusa acidovorans]|uniref:Protein FixB n=1 Tax=Sporomusa acidovorans (strain ATCC 49682 / DSM 3132 / Mol) TaxID=1123286 RepID=A0ABZ3IYE9_SPOA4|nr:electron transfer flavoprotein subunit alpha/FixB family protein [Sporomusa acidovorans]OZC16837.1 acryloyl-CoA reductase electron transfer subunit beta [Sporomusa acidovorans DSM 3132]SDF24058.1 electron transfer flavoprotein alpha subunit apoprotein [Sporomusa acidovorans]